MKSASKKYTSKNASKKFRASAYSVIGKDLSDRFNCKSENAELFKLLQTATETRRFCASSRIGYKRNL